MLRCDWSPLLAVSSDAAFDDLLQLGDFYFEETLGFDSLRHKHSQSCDQTQEVHRWAGPYVGHFTVDLGGVLTLRVRILGRRHLQDAHAEGVNVHGLIVLLLIHLWSHELRGP